MLKRSDRAQAVIHGLRVGCRQGAARQAEEGRAQEPRGLSFGGEVPHQTGSDLRRIWELNEPSEGCASYVLLVECYVGRSML